MPERQQILESDRPARTVPSRLGLVVHPTRPVDRPLRELRSWAGVHDVEVVQIRAACQQRRVAEQGEAADCDLLVSIGGDGTTLGTIRAGAIAARPVLAVACGSLGVLTSVPASALITAIERFSHGDWLPRTLPAIEVEGELGARRFAFNDVAIVRAAAGQLRLIAEVDGNVFARIAGDGCIVSTPLGSSAYALAAGGPLLMPEMDAFLLTPLPAHGGSCPPLVVSADSAIRLEVMRGQAGVRLELDGLVADAMDGPLVFTLRHDVATVVIFPDQEPLLGVLRKRQIIADSPRILAEDAHN
jgi:NAD+ kinase